MTDKSISNTNYAKSADEPSQKYKIINGDGDDLITTYTRTCNKCGIYGLFCSHIQDPTIAKTFSDMIVDNHPFATIHNIGVYYQFVDKNKTKMQNAYMKTIDCNNDKSMYNWAHYCKTNECTDENYIKYLKMASVHGNSNATHELGMYYFGKNDFDQMHAYHDKAIQMRNTKSMIAMGDYSMLIGRYSAAREYYGGWYHVFGPI